MLWEPAAASARGMSVIRVTNHNDNDNDSDNNNDNDNDMSNDDSNDDTNDNIVNNKPAAVSARGETPWEFSVNINDINNITYN